jgi:hypothetical protein
MVAASPRDRPDVIHLQAFGRTTGSAPASIGFKYISPKRRWYWAPIGPPFLAYAFSDVADDHLEWNRARLEVGRDDDFTKRIVADVNAIDTDVRP